MECLQRLQPNTALDVLKSESPSFSLLASKLGEHGQVAVKAIMTLQVNDLVDFFNIGKTMTASQVANTVNFLAKKCFQYKPDDLKLCFDRAKQGDYGIVYDRIDGQVILTWWDMYLFERDDEIEHFRIEEKVIAENVQPELYVQTEDIDPKDLPVPMPDYVKNIIHEIAVKKILPSKQVEKTEDQIIIDGFIADFNELHRISGQSSGVKYVSIYGAPGKTMDYQEYFEYRVLEYETGYTIEQCVAELKRMHEAKLKRIQELKRKIK